MQSFLLILTSRLLAAVEAQRLGRGEITQVSNLTGVARSTIGRGLKEIDGTTSPPAPGPARGRKPATERQPGLLTALVARGDPERPRVSKSTRHLAKCLEEQGFSASLVGRLLSELGYTPTRRPAKAACTG